ncbi:MAG: hypothetical protein CVU52_11105 [Deltaproteobacteria bacterium HGW-Deltaproteobacteria-10]|nr:MAG: hypothetical protein CVU52_11105 [Deltaproteobacteria bacterium HGW-Deltaproteobacteria-10]
MITKVKTQDIKLGMYVLLPKKWFAHPFLKNEFIIESREQITKLLGAGIVEVSIDTDRSVLPRVEVKDKVVVETIKAPQPITEAKPIIPPDLQEAIYDKKMPPAEKAQAIKHHSVVMIQRLMENPSRESIGEAKKGISEVVDVVLAEDNTNQQLLALTSHDYNTYVHSVNVGLLAISLAKSIFKGSNAHDMHELGAGFFLHDLGKVKIDINIILKPAVLTDEEILEIRKHPQYGYDILKQTNQSSEECRKVVLQHHERDNGRGYPQGLKGEDIHLYGRICSIADVFDALSAKRPYKQSLRPFEALNVMKEEMLEHFHKQLFQKFVLLFT